MGKRIALLFVLLVFAAFTAVAEICTVQLQVWPKKNIMIFDYGAGKVETAEHDRGKGTLTDVIVLMESKGWKLEHVFMGSFSTSGASYICIFRK